MNPNSDKTIEKERYNSRALNSVSNATKLNISSLPRFLQSPYICYQEYLSKILTKDLKILEIGSGMGENTGILIDSGAYVTVTDISADSLVFFKRAYNKNDNIRTVVADMEKLPFKSKTFDLVCSAGSLSYGDHKLVRDEINRVLKPNGFFVCIDSLNHNYIYKINRFIHYLRGNRTKSVIKRMPSMRLINFYEQIFSIEKINFFGSITWLHPILSIFIGNNSFAFFSDWFDKFINVRKSAFKFVLVLKKK
tara:strand:- start:7373 stop:8125 length:753 start_codon:yes stop_codon:yes gene_type:complete